MKPQLLSLVTGLRDRTIETYDADHFCSNLPTLLRPRILSLKSTGAPHFQLDTLTLGTLTVSAGGVGAELSAESAGSAEGMVVVRFAAKGQGELSLGRDDFPFTSTSAVIRDTPRHGRFNQSEHCRLVTVMVPRAAIIRQGAILMGRETATPLEFATGFSGPAFENWCRLLEASLATVQSSERYPRLEEALANSLLSSLLVGQANSWSHLLADVPTVLPKTLRRAIDYMESNIGNSVSLANAAQYAGVGLRALQKGFHTHLGVSPAVWWRNKRLDSAHGMLSRGDAGQVNVKSVALGLGFCNVGEFSARYRSRFGEFPSETLKRRV